MEKQNYFLKIAENKKKKTKKQKQKTKRKNRRIAAINTRDKRILST